MINGEGQTLVDYSSTESRVPVKPRVLVLASDVLSSHFFPESTRACLSEVAEWSQYPGRDDSPQLRAEIERADILMTTWHSPFLRMDMLRSRPRVQLIAHCGGEVKSRMEEKVFEHITVTNAAEPMAAPVAEMALALTLALVRRLPAYASEMHAGMVRTNEYVSHAETVSGRRVGVIGFGRIGKAFAPLIKPLAVALIVTDPSCTSEEVEAYGGTISGLDELLSSCSVVVLAAGLTPESRNLLDQRRLGLMPDGTYLINVARGGLIDMDALLPELRARRLTVALDVTDPLEPLPPDHELRQLPNVLLTPHIAAGGISMRKGIRAVVGGGRGRGFDSEQLQDRVLREVLSVLY